jgi:hypothetical protein
MNYKNKIEVVSKDDGTGRMLKSFMIVQEKWKV